MVPQARSRYGRYAVCVKENCEAILSESSLPSDDLGPTCSECLLVSWYPLPGHGAALPSMQNRNILIHRAGISII